MSPRIRIDFAIAAMSAAAVTTTFSASAEEAGLAVIEYPTRPRSYAGLLGIAYVVGPALSVGGALLAQDGEPAVIVALAAPGPFVPATIHWAHGELGRGFVSLAMQVVSAGAGALIGMGMGDALCDNTSGQPDSDPCLAPTVHGLIVGGVIAYAAWAVIDVSLFAEQDPREKAVAAHDHRPIGRLYASPLFAEAPRSQSPFARPEPGSKAAIVSREVVGVELRLGADF